VAESSAFSDAAENEIINVLLRDQAPTLGTTGVWVALVTAAVAESQTGATITEVANSNGYARQPVVFGAPAGGASSNTGVVSFTAAGGNWGTIVGIALVDSATHGAGALLMFDNSMTDVAINSGDSLTFAIGDIDVSVM
jgi:hypothetical protein